MAVSTQKLKFLEKNYIYVLRKVRKVKKVRKSKSKKNSIFNDNIIKINKTSYNHFYQKER
jgi:hypothetical protein